MADQLIAVVDDELPVRTALGHLLRSAGFDVLTYGSGSQFLEALQESEPDCVVLDLLMPDLNGYDVLKRLSVIIPKLPVVVITGHDQPQVKEKVLAAGANAYLTKPVMGMILMEAVNKVTQRA